MPPSKKSKNNQQNKLQAASTQPLSDVTVRDCLVWPQDNAKNQHQTASRDDVVYVSLRQQQVNSQSTSQLGKLRPPLVLDAVVDGSVGDALCGWPRYRKQCEQAVEQNSEEDIGVEQQKSASAKTKQAQATKSKTKSNASKQKDEDVHVADLISHRFLHEYVQQKQAELEREMKKKEAREKAAVEGRRAAKDRTDIKANKAAQLRAIAMADRVDVSPFDLWKMDKFTRSARSQVSTFRNGRGTGGTSASVDGTRGRKNGGRGGYSGFSGRYSGRSDGSRDEYDDVAGACTCADKLPYYYGSDVYAEDKYVCDGISGDNFADAGSIYGNAETSY